MTQTAGGMTGTLDNSLCVAAVALQVHGGPVQAKCRISEQADADNAEQNRPGCHAADLFQHARSAFAFRGGQRDIADQKIHYGASEIAGPGQVLDIAYTVHIIPPFVSHSAFTLKHHMQSPKAERLGQ